MLLEFADFIVNLRLTSLWGYSARRQMAERETLAGAWDLRSRVHSPAPKRVRCPWAGAGFRCPFRF